MSGWIRGAEQAPRKTSSGTATIVIGAVERFLPRGRLRIPSSRFIRDLRFQNE
jgi:hypothetical protein